VSLIAALSMVGFTVVGDGIPQPLTATPGDAVRGRALVVNRQQGLCLLCHSGPFAEVREQGNLGSNLQGAGARWTAAQLRLRVADARQLDPDGLMPSLHRVPPADSAQRVGAAWQGKPVLDAQQVEDVVAFLATLR
jgi:sulfur-oxidizing protein SoxX